MSRVRAQAARRALLDGIAGLAWTPGGRLRGAIEFTIDDDGASSPSTSSAIARTSTVSTSSSSTTERRRPVTSRRRHPSSL
jgi:hypothetical protein